jgi:hypothetical protein
MLKWVQNPKYYQNLISKWFVRRDTLGSYDVEIHILMSKGWWYKDKAKLTQVILKGSVYSVFFYRQCQSGNYSSLVSKMNMIEVIFFLILK